MDNEVIIKIPLLPIENGTMSSVDGGLRNLPIAGESFDASKKILGFSAVMDIGPHICDESFSFISVKLKNETTTLVLNMDIKNNNEWDLQTELE